MFVIVCYQVALKVMIQNYLEPWILVVDQHKSHCVLFIRFELLFQCQRSHLFRSSTLQLLCIFLEICYEKLVDVC